RGREMLTHFHWQPLPPFFSPRAGARRFEGTVLFVHKENQKTAAASESNANVVCKLPSGEEEGEAKL
ncbi:hypothetical protein, partial [uncultured Rikenella sp.]|uniref:hypothetical protein n=1 Tax=uncultured Rikenella sp. TaxID=368003 RepID=UPI00261DBFCF